jgi:hypothetical protein
LVSIPKADPFLHTWIWKRRVPFKRRSCGHVYCNSWSWVDSAYAATIIENVVVVNGSITDVGSQTLVLK